MNGITFSAWRDDKYVSLAEVVSVVEHLASEFTWELRLDEIAPNPLGERLEAVSRETRLETRSLLGLLAPEVQVIDGEVLGYATADSGTPALVIRAVDSMWWDVESDASDIIAEFWRAYPDAKPLPGR